MEHLREYEEEDLKNLDKDLKGIGFSKPLPPDNITADDFFEETMDHGQYMDVSGPAAQMAVDGIIEDFKERIGKIPRQHRRVAFEAIKEYWIDRIKNEFK